MPSPGYRSGSGFTLIEVLAAMLVIGIGLLGIAGLTAFGVSRSHNAYLTSMASLHSENIAELMRANAAGVAANHYADDQGSVDYDNISDQTFHCRPDIGNADVDDDGAIEVVSPGGGPCTVAQQAQADIWQWIYAIDKSLPDGGGDVDCQDIDTGDADGCTDGSTHLITVSWLEKDAKDIPGTPEDERVKRVVTPITVF